MKKITEYSLIFGTICLLSFMPYSFVRDTSVTTENR
jgi:hypothetical protein